MSIGISEPGNIPSATALAGRSARVIAIEPVSDRKAWNDLVARLPFPHLPQGHGYGEGKRAKGWEVKRVIFRRGEKTLGIATVLERRILGMRLVTRVNRGPMLFDPNAGDEDIRDVYAALRRHWRGPLLIAPALPHGPASDRLLRDAGFWRRHDNGWRSGRIDLTPGEDEIWAGFASTFRNRARQAAKLGATLHIAGDAETYEWMLARHAENMAEKGFSAADATLLRALRQDAPEDVTVFQLVHNCMPVAGMSVVRIGECVEYHIGWFGPEGRKLNAGNFLMWEIIKEMKRRGARQFDIGGLRIGDGYTRFKQTMKPVEFRLAGEWMSL